MKKNIQGENLHCRADNPAVDFLGKAFQGGNNRWYIYVLVLLFVFTVMALGTFPAAFHGLPYPWGGVLTPVQLSLQLLPYAAGVIGLLVGVRWFHGKRPTDILTGRARFDVGRCLHAALIWGGILLASTGVEYALSPGEAPRFQFDPLPFLGTSLALVVLLPFQVGWEEAIFRGYLMQGAAALFKYRWIPLAFTSIFFGLLHGRNPEVERFGFWVTMPQYILMGLILGYVAIKDGGVELSLGLHFANNLLATLLVTHESSALRTPALFLDPSPSASPWDAAATLARGLLFIWLCNRRYRFLSRNNLGEKIERE
ncbi:MAG: CPBP family intramembrane metalloprotease [Odoribacteraceae bacterium]|jgi:membrane protease YdiL (CAAX protease family)|nr:CPBP family intramembrane metalloprotease [Odoribacteraceae bacterium]